MDLTAGDRYRVEVRSGGFFKGLISAVPAVLSRPQAGDAGEPATGGSSARRSRGGGGGIVSIVDGRGVAVWSRPCRTVGERNELIRVIEEQVFTARLEDFEHWLRTEGRDNGGLA